MCTKLVKGKPCNIFNFQYVYDGQFLFIKSKINFASLSIIILAHKSHVCQNVTDILQEYAFGNLKETAIGNKNIGFEYKYVLNNPHKEPLSLFPTIYEKRQQVCMYVPTTIMSVCVCIQTHTTIKRKRVCTSGIYSIYNK